MTQGFTALVLHAHLPFVRHPEREDFLEERWLFEAVAECYLPLLEVLERLAADGIPFRMTISLSPTLMAMLDDPLLRARCREYMDAGVELAEREIRHTAGTPEEPVAHFYRHRLRKLRHLYTEEYAQDLLSVFHRLAQSGYLELITCGATHGFLPLLQHQPEIVRAQIRIAVAQFRHRFGYQPRGFWLPECGYFPGVEQFLLAEGIQYCLAETHAVMHARPSAPRGPFSHGWTPAGLAVFGRDATSSKQVWSADEGYPGDGAYREFHRDIGWDRDPAHLGRLSGPPGVRTFSGFKYHAITGRTEHKGLYDRWAAEQTAIRHAGHFVQARANQVGELAHLLPGDGPLPLVVAPYDAELFGHWWFEGPFFLEQVARQAAGVQAMKFITPSDYLNWYPAGQGVFEPNLSSWGYEGYADFWCDQSNHWIYRHLSHAGCRMVALAEQYRSAGTELRRVLNQAARELLLAQASDWAFLMRTGAATQYARHRQHTHLGRFLALTRDPHAVDSAWLRLVEAADNLFPNLDYRVYVPVEA